MANVTEAGVGFGAVDDSSEEKASLFIAEEVDVATAASDGFTNLSSPLQLGENGGQSGGALDESAAGGRNGATQTAAAGGDASRSFDEAGALTDGLALSDTGPGNAGGSSDADAASNGFELEPDTDAGSVGDLLSAVNSGAAEQTITTVTELPPEFPGDPDVPEDPDGDPLDPDVPEGPEGPGGGGPEDGPPPDGPGDGPLDPPILGGGGGDEEGDVDLDVDLGDLQVDVTFDPVEEIVGDIDIIVGADGGPLNDLLSADGDDGDVDLDVDALGLDADAVWDPLEEVVGDIDVSAELLDGGGAFSFAVDTNGGANRFGFDGDQFFVAGESVSGREVFQDVDDLVARAAELFDGVVERAGSIADDRLITGDGPNNIRVTGSNEVVIGGSGVGGSYKIQFGDEAEALNFEAFAERLFQLIDDNDALASQADELLNGLGGLTGGDAGAEPDPSDTDIDLDVAGLDVDATLDPVEDIVGDIDVTAELLDDGALLGGLGGGDAGAEPDPSDTDIDLDVAGLDVDATLDPVEDIVGDIDVTAELLDDGALLGGLGGGDAGAEPDPSDTDLDLDVAGVDVDATLDPVEDIVGDIDVTAELLDDGALLGGLGGGDAGAEPDPSDTDLDLDVAGLDVDATLDPVEGIVGDIDVTAELLDDGALLGGLGGGDAGAEPDPSDTDSDTDIDLDVAGIEVDISLDPVEALVGDIDISAELLGGEAGMNAGSDGESLLGLLGEQPDASSGAQDGLDGALSDGAALDFTTPVFSGSSGETSIPEPPADSGEGLSSVVSDPIGGVGVLQSSGLFG